MKWEERAVKLAVTRFGLDPKRVQQIYQDTVEGRKEGNPADLIENLVRAKLLSQTQSQQLRESLDKTQLDPASQVVQAGNGAAAANPPRPPFPRGGEGGVPEPALPTLGDYRILRKIGEGGMGEVFLAYDEAADREVAIKVLAPFLAANAGLVERFLREAQHAIKLNHPNIVRGHEVGQDHGTGKRYLVMEYVDGPSGQALLDEYGRLSVADTVHLALDIARALEYAQSHDVVHRDIKPENILCTRTGIAKLADLGLAKQLGQTSNLTATRQGFGTPYYMPPEQSLSARAADGRSDIYALGATLYHLVTGQVPFQADSQVEILEMKQRGIYYPATSVRPGIPEELNRILEKMMARDPRDRYQTASELIVDLERSKLASRVYSFVDQEAALLDPVVRARAEATKQPTQIDVSAARRAAPPAAKTWHLRYHDEETGRLCEITATTDQVLRRIRHGKLNGTVQASLDGKGPFRWLTDYPEFSDAMRDMGLSRSKAHLSRAESLKSGFVERGSWMFLVLLFVLFFLLAAVAVYMLIP